ncbi:MAG TPA: hypothetical protein PKE63_03345 [Lacibacter sp.]|nr:hypothetical protein [Lacibacter sp.]
MAPFVEFVGQLTKIIAVDASASYICDGTCSFYVHLEKYHPPSIVTLPSSGKHFHFYHPKPHSL